MKKSSSDEIIVIELQHNKSNKSKPVLNTTQITKTNNNQYPIIQTDNQYLNNIKDDAKNETQSSPSQNSQNKESSNINLTTDSEWSYGSYYTNHSSEENFIGLAKSTYLRAEEKQVSQEQCVANFNDDSKIIQRKQEQQFKFKKSNIKAQAIQSNLQIKTEKISKSKQKLNQTENTQIRIKKEKIKSKKQQIIQLSITDDQIELSTTTNRKIIKLIKSQYLQYLEKYFLFNFGILIPYHNQKIFVSKRKRQYIQIYFLYLKENYPQELLDFFLEENFYTEQTNFQQKFKYEYLLENFIYSPLRKGVQIFDNQIKKYLVEDNASLKKLQKMIERQIQFGEKMIKTHEALTDLLHIKIECNIYEKNEIQKKYYILNMLEWLIGFQQAYQFLKKLIVESERVQAEKFRKMLQKFEKQKTQVFKSKILALEKLIKQILKNDLCSNTNSNIQ